MIYKEIFNCLYGDGFKMENFEIVFRECYSLKRSIV